MIGIIVVSLALTLVGRGAGQSPSPIEAPYTTTTPKPPKSSKPPKPPKLINSRFGVNPAFILSPNERQTIKSPTLVWSLTSRFMVFNYTIVEVPENFTMSYKVMCLRQKPGKKAKGHRVKKGFIKLDTTPHKGKPRRWCRKIYDNETEADACTSFYVLIETKMDVGEIHLSEFQFGRPTICLPKEKRPKKTAASCNFEGGDCEYKNDACGLTEWTLKESDESVARRKRDFVYFLRRRREVFLNSGEAVALTKETTVATCNFRNISIPNLQLSGFTVSSEAETERKKKRRRRFTVASLYLDPADSANNLAMGMFNTPSVVYHTANSVLSFSFRFSAEGLHQIVIGVVCTSGTEWVKLKRNEEYQLSNFEIVTETQSGFRCLNLHKYVSEEKCSEFAVQFVGAAAYSALIIDDVNFCNTLNECLCTETDN